MAIHVLPDEVISRIAAGEAVERPASAVKELIENAIDASATSVHIEATAGGRQLLRVSDNGTGISNAEIALAFRRHATSKLRAAADLLGVKTLGFRGEALASIAAVSRATVVTRHRNEDMGVTLKLDGGRVLHQRQIGAPAGTVVTIENLFFNTPARLKFLKKDATEKRHILWTVARYALAYPGIAFTLILDGRERFRSSGSGDLADVVSRAFGLQAYKCMVPVESIEQARPGQTRIDVAGYTSLPSISRASRDRIILFVNGRAIQDSALSHAVTQAYDGMLKAGAYPQALVLIKTPADFVDVNVHPTKAEVRFRDSNLVFVAVQRAIREALVESSAAPPPPDLWSSTGFSDQYIDYQRPQPGWQRTDADDLFDNDGLNYIPAVADEPAKPRTLPVLRVVGQVGATYIIAEGPAGLYLVDQNAAHETVLVDQIREDLANGGLPALTPADTETILLSPDDAEFLITVSDLFAALCFEIEPFGPNAFAVRRLPTLLAGTRIADALPQMLNHLRPSRKTQADAIHALALAAAIRRGQVIELSDMSALIARLERCPSPLHSPGGTKTLIHLSREQLADEFRRA